MPRKRKGLLAPLFVLKVQRMLSLVEPDLELTIIVMDDFNAVG